MRPLHNQSFAHLLGYSQKVILGGTRQVLISLRLVMNDKPTSLW